MTYERGTFLEFFAGIGLARMGLERAGWQCVFANDFDPKKLEMHEGHWGKDLTYALGDIHHLDPVEVPEAEMAWASFPCIDLSLAGNRAGLNGQHSGAFWGFAGLIDALHAADRCPPLMVIENVVGMLSSGAGQDLREILLWLNRLDYVVDIIELDAAHFVPQSRPRLFIVGVRPPYSMPLVALRPVSSAKPSRVDQFVAGHPEIAWGTLPLGALPLRGTTFADLAERFPEDADIWWPQDAVDKLASQMNTRHRQVVAELVGRAETSFATVYKRVRSTGCMAEVRFDGVAGCLRTPKGGSSKQFVLEMGWGQLRARNMTAIEYGRLQGAEDFKIRVPFNQALFGFGDAVCVPAVQWLAENCLLPIRAEESELALVGA